MWACDISGIDRVPLTRCRSHVASGAALIANGFCRIARRPQSRSCSCLRAPTVLRKPVIAITQLQAYSAEDQKPATFPSSNRGLLTLAAGDTEGGISLFAFETLQLLHRIETLDEVVAGMIFASNSLRLYDVRGRSCNIWEPSVLARKRTTDDNSSDPEDPEPSISGLTDGYVHRNFNDSKVITVITPAGDDKLVFCGRDDGTISLHELRTGKQLATLHLHSATVQNIEWSTVTRLLVTTDVSRRCRATRLPSQLQGLSFRPGPEAIVFDRRSALAVSQVMIKPDGSAVLLASQTGEEVCQGDQVTRNTHGRGAARWVQHPTDRTRLLLCQQDQEGTILKLFNWAGLTEDEDANAMSVNLGDEFRQVKPTGSWLTAPDVGLLMQAVPSSQGRSAKTAFIALGSNKLQPGSSEIHAQCAVPQALSLGGVKAIIGLTRSTLVFLTRSGWVCSISLKSFPELKSYTSHLYIPPFWRTQRDFPIRVVAKNTVAIGYRDDLITIQGFLDFEHKHHLE